LRPRDAAGFSLIEVLVGLIIFVVGLAGFVGMTMMQAQGNRVAKGSDEASTLLQSEIEDFANVLFNALGTDAVAPSINGLTGANVMTQGPLNRIGDPQGTGTGPYSYYRSAVVCTSATTGITAGANYVHCGSTFTAALRPPELACDALTPALTAREKMIRVMVSWTDRNGRCHYRTSNSLTFNWAG
jgi:prepilin-type N-terminal cleavage/methylation domain-containing protein